MLEIPGAVAGEGLDAGVAAHYGSFVGEQRALESGVGFVDLSHRDVIAVSGADRLTWLHDLTTQDLARLAPQVATDALILSPQGRIEHAFSGLDDGEIFWAHTEPGGGAALAEYLDRMRFMTRVQVSTVADRAVIGLPGGAWRLVRRADLADVPAELGAPAGIWAAEALRIAAGRPRIGLDTDDLTIPNEIGLGGVALDKGCYRGQETVARVHNLGRPPRRLVRLHLDGSAERLPAAGSVLEIDGRSVGFVGGSARHHELGPIALALVKRAVDPAIGFTVDGVAAAQEVIVDPEVGLHVRPRL